MTSTNWPQNFFSVVGAPRCGTSAISSYLSEHPEVCFSRVKEPHYFTLNDFSDLNDSQLREVLARDFIPRFFEPSPPASVRIWGEGSVSHFYHPEAALQLLRTWPTARFIIAVRDPMQMLPSLHQRSLYTGDEVEESFTRAWQLQEKRKRGEAIPKTCIDPRLLYYADIGRLGHYLQGFFDSIGRERCHVVVFDDLATDTAGVYRQLLAFLNLSDDGRQHFARVRKSQGYRSGTLQRWLKRPPQKLRSLLAGEKFSWRVKQLKETPLWQEKLRQAVFKARRKLQKLNNFPMETKPLEPLIRREIHDLLKDDVALLSRLLDRDLSHWLKVES
ncbi:MAG: hypothetical protein CVV13_03125 [Gammaproteobacteria bacterium HGW-Gammaproteobacteria-3]|nr:MAG: hypothetical protein CVV13_03125 [Gammaproteobacteria bacterium HGW-Gammaproteobacteria-3]